MSKLNAIRRKASKERARWTAILKDAEAKGLSKTANIARRKLHAISGIKEPK